MQRYSMPPLPWSSLVRFIFAVGKSGTMKTAMVEKDQAKVHFNRLDVHSSMRPSIVHLQVLRKPVNVVGYDL